MSDHVRKGNLHGVIGSTSDDGEWVKVIWEAPRPTWERVADLNKPVCPKCGLAGCLEDKEMSW